MRAVFPGDELGIPSIVALDVLPERLINYNARNRLWHPESGDCVHFFLDDYRFEIMWTQPERALTRVIRVGKALSPDFSLYPEMPRIAQMWNIYRSRWCGAWMASHGVQVVPTVVWSDLASHAYAFRGLDRGGTVAVSTVGLVRARPAEQSLFLAGYEAMLATVAPARVLIYGKRFPGIPDQVEQVYYDTRRWS